jgi:hypothetical protein
MYHHNTENINNDKKLIEIKYLVSILDICSVYFSTICGQNVQNRTKPLSNIRQR